MNLKATATSSISRTTEGRAAILPAEQNYPNWSIVINCRLNLLAYHSRRSMRIALLIRICLISLLYWPGTAGAWGDLGHRIVGAVAEQELKRNYPVAWRKIEAMLAADHDPLTPSDFPSRAMWADKYAQSDRDGD